MAKSGYKAFSYEIRQIIMNIYLQKLALIMDIMV